MKIREANQSDIPDIIKVLKASLGEESSKKTEKVWRYKHIDNPFGKSLVLVAEEKNTIIGVRAFMRWNWQKGDKVYSAFRAVDTATHPDHQGKGIFKELTLHALGLAKERGDHFVFNTPNDQSKPGYLKMGWEEINKLKIVLRPLNPFKRKFIKTESYTELKKENCEILLKKFQLYRERDNQLFTPKNLNYLSWRYENNPLQNYIVSFCDDYFIAGYVKKHRGIKEFRVSEAIFTEKSNLTKLAILEIANKTGADILSISPLINIDLLFRFTAGIGPVLTFKNINLDDVNRKKFLELANWNYSLGDLELY